MLENIDRERECIYIYMAYEKRREQATKTTAQRFFSPWCIFLLALLSFFTIETSYTYSTNQAGFLPQYIEKDKNRSRSYILKNILSKKKKKKRILIHGRWPGLGALLHVQVQQVAQTLVYTDHIFVKEIANLWKKEKKRVLVHIRGYSHGNGILGKPCR